MNNAGRQLCRFCLKIIRDENFETVGEITLKILDVLSIEMNVSLDEICLMCRDCQGDIERCFNFKTACLHSEDNILEYITKGSKLDLEKVYLKKRLRQRLKRIPRGHKICRLCKKVTSTPKSLNNTNDLMASTNDKLQKFIPELNLDAVKNPVICETCLVGVQSCSEFIDGVLDVEKKINTYCSATGVDKSQVQLYSVLQFIMKDVLECNMSKLKKGQSAIEVNNCTIPSAIGFYIKEEKVQLKLEDDIDSSCSKGVNCEIGSISRSQIVNEDKNGCYLDREKQEDELFLPGRVKREIVDDNELKDSTKQDIKEQSIAEIYIKNEEIEIKSEDADMNDSEHCNPQGKNVDGNKSYKKRKYDKEKEKRRRAGFCEICSTSYSTKDTLALHKFYTHKEGPQPTLYNCDQCTFVTVYKNSIGLHKVVHKNVLEAKLYKCPECPYRTKYKSNLGKHTLNHKSNSEIQMHCCPHCSYKTIDKRHMKYHDMTHKDISELATYDCFHCPYKAKVKAHLRRHMMTHKGSYELKTYKCNICSFQTKYKTSLSKHLLVHKDKPEIYYCNKCAFQTKCRTTLKEHKLTHINPSKLKDLKCKICPYQAISRSKFRQHSLVHQKVKPIHKCTHCSYQSMKKSALKIHLLRVHKDERVAEMPIFKCLHCSYQTIYKQNLIAHVHAHRAHSSLELYKCQTCGGEYNKGYLTVHQRTCVQ